MRKPVFTTERITPLTMSLLAFALMCTALGVAHEFAGMPLPFARVFLIAGPLASFILALVTMRKIDWTR